MGSRKRWAGITAGAVAIALLSAACVTVVRTFEVDLEVSVPCASWPDTLAGDTFDVEVFRAATVIQDLNTVGIACRTETKQSIGCDQSVTSRLELGFVPEWIGVRVTRSDGTAGYAVQRVLGAGYLDLAMGPDLNDWVQADYCREVAACLFGEDAVDYCAGLAQPILGATPTPGAEPSPTPVDETTPTPESTPEA